MLQTYDLRQCGRCDQQSLRSACPYAQSDQSLCLLLEYSLTVKLLTEKHLVFPSLKGGYTGSSVSLHMSKFHIVGNHMSRLILKMYYEEKIIYQCFLMEGVAVVY